MSAALLSLLPVVLGFLLDLLLGDPAWLYHPVRLIGRLIGLLERALRRAFPKMPGGELLAGRLLSAAVPLLVLLAAQGLLLLAARLHFWAWFALETVLCYQLFALRSLREESMAVHDALKQSDLSAARGRLSRIVGRETQSLDREGIVRAAVETVAENTADGIIAPMLYMLLGGAGLGYCYKAVNTLDSMVGYKSERYRHFGRASAKLDDAASFLPARLAAHCMVWASGPAGFDRAGALRVWRRDRRNHASPNSAQTEAACAGALGLRLGGDASYFGQTVHKPVIGDDTRPPEAEDIPRANRLAFFTSVLCLFLLCALKAAALLCLGRQG